MASAVHIFIVSLPTAKSDCYEQASDSVESPAIIDLGHKWTNLFTLQSFIVPVASEESLREADE